MEKKEKLRKELMEELLKESPTEDKIHQISQELSKMHSIEEKAEVEQIIQEAAAEVHAKNPPPKTMYV